MGEKTVNGLDQGGAGKSSRMSLRIKPSCQILSKALAMSRKIIRLIDGILTAHCSAARGLLTTDHEILNHGQVTWMTPELAPFSPNYHTTPTGKRFNSQQI
ncbi:hypothetical protein TNCV_2954691 [Trichonephila clavipes]|nr:hypothetical protein TNCV_2954691 [Trichonephila clavipes]